MYWESKGPNTPQCGGVGVPLDFHEHMYWIQQLESSLASGPGAHRSPPKFLRPVVIQVEQRNFQPAVSISYFHGPEPITFIFKGYNTL